MSKTTRLITSLGIVVAAAGLAYAPTPGLERTVTVVSGTELQEPLQALEAQFEQAHPDIKLDLKFQGSRDIVNNYLDDNNDFDPTVIIPANGELLEELGDRWQAQEGSDPFYDAPQPIAKTMLVGIAWSERGAVLFPNSRFDWQRVEAALTAGTWGDFGGASNWGSFDLVITDPARSNSGQLALSLWSQDELGGGALTANKLTDPDVQNLFGLVKRSVYQPPRSTDVLLQEFIARGPNDADVAIVYESIALHRWEQSATTQGKPYQIYYLDPTIETISTAAIVTRDVNRATADAARTFLEFLTAPEQQEVFVQFGFRPAAQNLDLQTVTNSPWADNIPGAQTTPPSTTTATPDQQTLAEVIRLWQRAN
ncbi:MAG: substrate-binding domain-containing protein [Synechococcales bacterium]|nr:substrate-binding domain-containing protein [Synechococcales bacterium]